MTQLTELQVATWRIPQSDSDQLEAVAEVGQDPLKLEQLKQNLEQEGLFYLATCQRVVIATSGYPELPLRAEEILVRLSATLGWEEPRVEQPEFFVGEAAFAHLGAVAASLDSLVPGEPQVLGQFREAFKQCRQAQLINKDLDRLLGRVLKVAKRVRNRTNLFRGSVSLVPLTTRFLSQAVEQAQRGCCQVAVVGTGHIGLALLSKLAPHKNLHLYCVSHSLERAEEVAARVPNHTFAMALEEFLAEPPCLDAMALATVGQEPFIGSSQVTRIMERRCPGHPGDGGLRVLDLAMPRNARREIRDLRGCELVQIDDLVELSEHTREARQEAIAEAQAILDQELANLRRERWKKVHQERILQLRSSLELSAKERLESFPGDIDSDPKLKRWMERTLNGLIHVAQERLIHALEMVEVIYPRFHTEEASGGDSPAHPDLPSKIPPAMAEALKEMDIQVPGARSGTLGAEEPSGHTQPHQRDPSQSSREPTETPPDGGS